LSPIAVQARMSSGSGVCACTGDADRTAASTSESRALHFIEGSMATECAARGERPGEDRDDQGLGRQAHRSRDRDSGDTGDDEGQHQNTPPHVGMAASGARRADLRRKHRTVVRFKHVEAPSL